jgi:DNA-binding transcriptional regulator YhcF (GntR family)
MEFNDNSPIYQQIADLVMEKILTGQWNADDRIPSVRETASSLEVNPNTVAHAYAYLQEQGIIYNQRGIGYHVAPEGAAQARSLKREAFIRGQLPVVFRTMQVLNMSIDELTELYQQYIRNKEIRNENEQ